MPERVLASISTALAGRAVSGLTQYVEDHFAGDAEAMAALQAAERHAQDSAALQELGAQLARHERDDPEFSKRLRAEWAAVRLHTECGGVSF